MPIIVQDVLEDIAPFVGLNGTCVDHHERIIKYLNKLCELLWFRGDWKGTIEYGCISATDCQFGLPWHLDEIRDAWFCNQTMLVQDQYYETFSHVGIQSRCGGCCMPQLIQTGQYHPYQKKPPTGWRLAVQGTAMEEVELSFQSFDQSGQRWDEKVIPNLDTQKLNANLGELYTVTKPRTQGLVRVLAWHPDHTNYEFVAKYDAHQEAPGFSHYKLTGITRGNLNPQIILRAKKKYIPIRALTDTLWLESRAALEFAALALDYKLAKDNAKYAENLNLAEEQLEEILENQQPKAWTPLQVHYQPQALSPQSVGRLNRWGTRGYGR